MKLPADTPSIGRQRRPEIGDLLAPSWSQAARLLEKLQDAKVFLNRRRRAAALPFPFIQESGDHAA